MADDKSYIIDPLTSLCKVALLHFMPQKTRLAINHHVLHVQDHSYYQWLERKINRDSRIDISNLNTPFIKAIHWYLVEGAEKAKMDRTLELSIRTIASFTVKGLIKLQEKTYSDDLSIRIIIQYFINLLTSALNGSWTEDSCSKIDRNHNILSDRIKYNYEEQTVISIAKMLTDADNIKQSQEDVQALTDCVHKLLINRDTQFVKLMQDVNTSL